MKKKLLFICFCISFWCNAQIGIGTTDPKAVLDIKSTNQANPSSTDGILVPKIDTFPATNPGVDQQGMLVYLTTTVGANAPGFYYWDNLTTTWKNIAGTSGGTLDQAYDFGGLGNGNTITADSGSVLIGGTDGFISTGTLNSGAIVPNSTGVIMYWNPRKAAFRAGSVSGAQWDDVNIGQSSAAFGQGTTANGFNSSAFGQLTTASGDNSTAFGELTVASNYGAIALGVGTNASGIVSTSVGSNTTASGNMSAAFGSGTAASGISSTAFGTTTIASGNNSTAFGLNSIASGANSTAFGSSTTASSDFSFSTGFSTIADGLYSGAFGEANNALGKSAYTFGGFNSSIADYSSTFGRQNFSSSYGELTIGIGATAYVPTSNGETQFRTTNETDRLFVVGNAIDNNGNGFVDSAERSDAMVILKNGNIGIGSSTPQDKLHVVGNIRMVDGNQAVGKVLTSDANGIATWQIPSINAWSLTGNSGTAPGADFIGTTDNQNVIFKRNNIFNGGLGEANLSLGNNSRTINGPPDNTAIGIDALNRNSGQNNTALGRNTLGNNTTGSRNVAIGRSALNLSGISSDNTAVGHNAFNSIIGNENTALGSLTRASTTLFNATAIGARAEVGSSNSMVLGSINGVNGATTDVNVGIGTTTPLERLHIVGNIRMEDGNQSVGKVLTSDVNGTATWQSASANVWGLSGNTGTSPGTNFVGTTDNQDLVFKTSNIDVGRLTEDGKFAFGMTNFSDSWRNLSKVEIGSNDNINDLTLRSSGTDALAINIVKSRGTMNAPVIPNVGDEVGSFRFWAYNQTGPFSGYANAGRIATRVISSSVGNVNTSLQLSSTGGSILIDDIGNVGIGTQTPDRRLHVVNSGVSGGTPFGTAGIVLESNAQVYQQFLTPSNRESGLLFGNESSNIRAGILYNSGNPDGLSFRTGGNNTRMAITNAGDVGIGTLTPNRKLEVINTGSVFARITSSDGNPAGIELLRTGNTGNDWQFQDENGVLTINRGLVDFTSTLPQLRVATNEFTSGFDGVMTLGSNARRWLTVNAVVGVIQTSDRREKQNIQPLNYGLDKIMNLQPVSFKWINNKIDNHSAHLGFIAQDLQETIPEVVIDHEWRQSREEANPVWTETERLGVNYAEIIPVLVKAMQEQQALIESLQKRIDELEKNQSPKN